MELIRNYILMTLPEKWYLRSKSLPILTYITNSELKTRQKLRKKEQEKKAKEEEKKKKALD